MPMRGTTTSADLYDEVKKMLLSLDIPMQKLVELGTDGAPGTVRRSSGVS